jgi:hypothetical protein
MCLHRPGIRCSRDSKDYPLPAPAFWATPTRKLYDLFRPIHSMKEQSPAEVVALSVKYEVLFLPPPA